jgi:L-lactate dehydrogenase complex protein LldG
MKGTARNIFLDRIRAALGRSPGQSVEPLVVDYDMVRPSLPESADVREKLRALFIDRAVAVGMKVLTCQRAEVAQVVVNFLTEAAITSVQISSDPIIEQDLVEKMIEASIRVAGEEVELDVLYQEIECGITMAKAAVASTGSVVVTGSDQESRLTSLVPPNHLVLLSDSHIVEDLLDLTISLEDLPSCMTLVTGPSKTADIEGVLITGVHGPGRVQIVLFHGESATPSENS